MNTSDLGEWCREVDSREVNHTPGHWSDEDVPVIALVGSYSAGKTTLIRRILHEQGLPSREDLSVASDPTTFSTQDVHVGFAVLRDTPGLGSGKDLHNRRAVDAAVEADAVVLVMTPQLLSGSDSDAWDLLTGAAWGRQEQPRDIPGLVLVINRFDMAGPDPESELPAYRALAGRKREELQKSLVSRGIPASPPILVTAGDPFGLAAVEGGSKYDQGDEWDGIHELMSTLKELTAQLTELRTARNARMRGRALQLRARELSTALRDLEAARAQTALRKHHAERHKRELARLWAQAAAEREQLLHDAIGLDAVAAAAPDRASLLRGRLEKVLDDWGRGLDDRLRAYAQASPELQLLGEPPAAEAPSLAALRQAEVPGDPLMESLKALRDNAGEVKAAAKAFGELNKVFPALAKVGKYVTPELVDVAVTTATVILNVTAEGRSAERAALMQRDHYMKIAIDQSDRAIEEVRAWSERYDATYAGLCQQIDSELDSVTATIESSRKSLDATASLLRSMPI